MLKIFALLLCAYFVFVSVHSAVWYLHDKERREAIGRFRLTSAMTSLASIPASLGVAFAEWGMLRYACIAFLLAGAAFRVRAFFVAQVNLNGQFLPPRGKSKPPVPKV